MNSNENDINIGLDVDELGLGNLEEIKSKARKSTKGSRKNTGTGVLKTAHKETNNDFIRISQDKAESEQKKEELYLKGANKDFPYIGKKLLTDAELQLYHFMENNLCQKERIVILTKVRLGDIVDLDTRITTDMKYFWKVTNKHVDFIICNKDTMDIICAVELDDYTHENNEHKQRDLFVMQVLDTVGIQTIRVRSKIRLISKADLELIDLSINTALAPKCPQCGRKMYPKIARADKHRFYACEDFIGCRTTIDIDGRGEKLP